MGQPTAPEVRIQIPQDFKYGPTLLQPIEQSIENGDGTTNGTNGENGITKHDITPLDVLENFTGTFAGFGFNTIFRPKSSNPNTPTPLPIMPPDTHNLPDDNVLQWNLTTETMVFSNRVGDVPNRGVNEQADIMLDGVPYTQTILDAMSPSEPNPPVIHFEPGLWMRIPGTEMPNLKSSYVRKASIPQGTSINAHCFEPARIYKGAPDISIEPITPAFVNNGPPQRFPSQDARNKDTSRIP